MQFKTFCNAKWLAFAAIVTLNAQANMINNGDFSSCDYNKWQTSTDFSSGSANDFSIQNNGSTCSAELQVDHFDASGAPINDAWFFNSLSQGLDFTGNSTSSWILSIDFAVDSELTSSDPFFIADNFAFGIVDSAGNFVNGKQNPGYLVSPTDIDGAFTDIATFELDSSFSNLSGLTLDMQLNIGTDSSGWTDEFGSTLLINSVSLIEKLASVAKVPEPPVVAIIALGIAGLLRRKKQL